MITIQSYGKTKLSSDLLDINKDDSILIIDKGGNEYKLNEFYKPKNSHDVLEKYGESSLYKSYIDAKSNGANNVYVMNCSKITDYISSIEIVKLYNFSYVVPVGIKISDTFYSEKYEREMYFAEYYLIEFGKFTNSTIIFTDAHASLYENIDHYIFDMESKISKYKDNCKYVLDINGISLIFCLNNLENYDHSNVVLASMLSATPVGKYPSNMHTNAIFDIDKSDLYQSEIVFFKNNHIVDTTIENLKNFRTIDDACKIVTISSVIKYIQRNLDTSFVSGKLYNEYLKMNLHDYLDMFFRKLIGSMITNYIIRGISFTPAENMTCRLTADIEIFPINSLESINAMVEV